MVIVPVVPRQSLHAVFGLYFDMGRAVPRFKAWTVGSAEGMMVLDPPGHARVVFQHLPVSFRVRFPQVVESLHEGFPAAVQDPFVLLRVLFFQVFQLFFHPGQSVSRHGNLVAH